MLDRKSVKSALESMLFVWGEPLEAKPAADALGIGKEEALGCFRELMEEYERETRGIRIRETDGSFQFVTCEENADYVTRLCTPVRTRRLSQSALEVLAIVAYKQPVTKAEVEAIRGIKCDRVMEGLMRRDLVCEAGRAETVGRPVLYATTKAFLQYFGFTTLRDLPPLEDVEGTLRARDDEESGDEEDVGADAGQIEGQVQLPIDCA